MPRFALLSDTAVPFYMPLSPWRRVSYTVNFVWTAIFYFRHGGHEGCLHYLAASLAIIVALVGSVLLLRQRDLSRDPQPEEAVCSYRTALANEFERQFKKERLILMLLFGGGILPGALLFFGHLFKYRSADQESLAAGALFAIFLGVGMRMYLRVANAVRSQLKDT